MAADWLMSAVANLHGAFRKMLIGLLEKFSEMFTEVNKVLCISTAEMSIKLKDDTLINYLNKVQEWTSAIPKLRVTLNTMVRETTGFASLRLLIGINASVIPVQNLIESIPLSESNINVHDDRLLAHHNIIRNAASQKTGFDRNRRNNQKFKVGDFVFIPKTNARAGKLEAQFRGPYKIIEQLPGDCFWVENRRLKRGPLVVPRDRIKRWPGEW
jgi:hypothetical protein